MTRRRRFDPSRRDIVLCEEQLLFVVGREAFGKLQDASHVFACTHLSICASFPFLPGMNLCWLVIMWLGETKEWDPNRHSALWRISTARMCCHYMSNPHLRQRRLPSRPSLQLNRLQWRNGARQSLCTVWLHSFCNVYQSVTNSVYMGFCGVLVTSVPRLNQNPHPHPHLFTSGHRRQKLDTIAKSLAWLGCIKNLSIAVFQCSTHKTHKTELLVYLLMKYKMIFNTACTDDCVFMCPLINNIFSSLLKTSDPFPFIRVGI